MSVVYELTIFADDDVAELFDVSTDIGHVRPYLKAPLGFPEQEVNFAKGTASIGQVNIQIVDVPTVSTDQKTGYMTGRLSSAGLSALNGHRALLTEDIDGAGPATVLDGVVRSVRLLDNFSGFELELRDIRERERKTKAFGSTSTPTIVPRGVLDGYGVQFSIFGLSIGIPIGPTRPLKALFRTDQSNSGVFVIDFDIAGVKEKLLMTAPVRDALESITELAGQPEVLVYDRWKVLWRDRAAGGAYNELTQVAHYHPDLSAGTNRTTYLFLTDGSLHVVRVNNAITGDTLPANNQICEIIVQYDGPISEDWRLHLQGLTAGELLRNLYRGDYSDEDPRIRYNEAALLALTTPVRMRLSKSVDDVRDWAEKNLYPIVHAAPTLNAAGEIAPITYLLPDAAEILAPLDDSNCRPSGGGWSQASDDAVNVVRVSYERLYRVRSTDDAGNQVVALSDTLQSRKVTIEHRIQESIDLLGEQVLEVDSVLLSSFGNADGGPIFGDVDTERGAQVAERISRMATDRFALGGQYFSLHADRSDTDFDGLLVGSWVTVAVSWMPDYGTGKRGLNRLAQVIGRRNLSGAWTALTLIDAGTAQAPLAGPTLGSVTADAAGVVSVPVTALGAGAEARVDYAISTLEPAAGATEWTFLGRVTSVPTTLTTPQVRPDTKVWVRARSENIGRRPSVYTTAVSVTVAAISRVLEVFIRVAPNGVPTVEWEPNAHTLGVRIAYEVHYAWELPTYGTSVDVDASDRTVELATTVFDPKVISVRVTAYPGWTGAAVSGSAGEATTERVIGAVLRPGLRDVRALYEIPTVDDATIRWTRNSNTFAVWVYLQTLPLPIDDSDNPWPDDTTLPTVVLPIGTDEYVVAIPEVGNLSFLQLEPRGEDGEPGNPIRVSIDPKAGLPEIAVSLTIDETGILSANVQGNEDTASIKILASKVGQPSDADTRLETAKDGRMFTTADIGTLLTLDIGETGYVTVFAYNATGGGGIESLESVKNRDKRAGQFKPSVFVKEVRTAGVSVVTIDVADPFLIVTAIEYKKRDGVAGGDTLDASWLTAWTSTVGTIGASSTLQRVINVPVEAGLEGELQFRVQFTDPEGNTQTIGDSFKVVNLEEADGSVVVPFTSVIMATETTDFLVTAAGYLRPGSVTTITFLGTFLFPPGVTWTGIEITGYIETGSDRCDVNTYRVNPLDVAGSILNTVDLSTTGAWSTKTDTVSETINEDAIYYFHIVLESTSLAVDARFRGIKCVYTRPAYDKVL